jgi:streptogramin lyase
VVDPESQETTSYPLPARCLQLTASEAVVVATCAVDNLVVGLDPETGSEVGRASLESPRIAAATEQDIWVDTSHGLTRLDTDLEVRAVYPNQVVGLEGDLAVAADELWVRGTGGVLWRIDPADNTVAEQLSASPALSAGSLLVTDDSLWASDGNGSAVLHLRRAA